MANELIFEGSGFYSPFKFKLWISHQVWETFTLPFIHLWKLKLTSRSHILKTCSIPFSYVAWISTLSWIPLIFFILIQCANCISHSSFPHLLSFSLFQIYQWWKCVLNLTQNSFLLAIHLIKPVSETQYDMQLLIFLYLLVI